VGRFFSEKPRSLTWYPNTCGDVRFGPIGDGSSPEAAIDPQRSLKRAWERRDEARRLIADGVEPAIKRQAGRRLSETFEAVAREWLTIRSSSSVPRRELLNLHDRLEDFIFP
jgi:hypothetical protein